MNPTSPNQALQRTPGFAVQLPGTGCSPTGSVTRCTARHDRVKGLRPHAAGARAQPARAPRTAVLTAGPESLSFGSLGASSHLL